jgi:hypothetical protein
VEIAVGADPARRAGAPQIHGAQGATEIVPHIARTALAITFLGAVIGVIAGVGRGTSPAVSRPINLVHLLIVLANGTTTRRNAALKRGDYSDA